MRVNWFQRRSCYRVSVAAIPPLVTETKLKKLAYALTILGMASTMGLAEDLKQEKQATAPKVSATQMTDSEMDKVTAGFNIGQQPFGPHGQGLDNGHANNQGRGAEVSFNHGQTK